VIDNKQYEGIKRSPWFLDLPDAALNDLCEASSVSRFSKGQAIYKYGEARDQVYGLLSGSVRVGITTDNHQHYTLIDLYENSWFGESAMLRNQAKIITVSPLETCNVILLYAKDLILIADEYPHIYRNMYFDKLRSVQLTYDLIGGLLTYPLKARIAMRLIPIIEKRGVTSEEGVFLKPCISLSELARISMGSLQRITLIFDEWVEQGIIVHDKGGWLFPDVEILKIQVHL